MNIPVYSSTATYAANDVVRASTGANAALFAALAATTGDALTDGSKWQPLGAAPLAGPPVKVSGLPAGSQAEGGRIVCVQAGESRAILIDTGALNPVGFDEDDIPQLGPEGRLAIDLGGTGPDVQGTNLYFGRNNLGAMGFWSLPSGGGGGGASTLSVWNSTTTYGAGEVVLDSANQEAVLYRSLAASNTGNALSLTASWQRIGKPVPDAATKDDIHDGTSTTKYNTPAATHTLFQEITEELADFGYTAWGSGTNHATPTLPTGASTIFPGSTIGFSNASSVNASSVTIPSGQYLGVGPLCAGLPSMPQGNFEIGLIFDNPAPTSNVSGVRWLVGSTNLAGNRWLFKWTGSQWQHVQEYNDSAIAHNWFGLPENGPWGAVDAQAYDGPDRGEVWIGRRFGNQILAAQPHYDSANASTRYQIRTNSKALEVQLQPGQITNVDVASDAEIEITKIKVGGVQAAGAFMKATSSTEAEWSAGGSTFATASTAEIRAGTENSKAATPLGLKPILDDLRANESNGWSAWSAADVVVRASDAQFVNGVPLTSGIVSSGANLKGYSFTANTFAFVKPSVTDRPQQTNFAWGMAWMRGTERYVLAVSTANATQLYRLNNNSWDAIAANDVKHTIYDPLALPKDGQLYVVSSDSQQRPTARQWIVQREGTTLRGWSPGFLNSAPQVDKRTRSSLVEDSIVWQATSLSNGLYGRSQTQTLTSPRKFSDYDELALVTNFQGQITDGAYVSGWFPYSTAPLIRGSTLFNAASTIHLPCPPNFREGSIRIHTDTTFTTWDNKSSNRLVMILGRRRFA